MLFQKETRTAFRRYPLATGPEGVTLEGRKMAMAGKRAFRKQRTSMPTLLTGRHLNIYLQINDKPALAL